jgi:hypothetical protein
MTPAGLGRLLRASRGEDDGLVPVVGTGVNNEAARIDLGEPEDDWASLVDAVGEETGMTGADHIALPDSFLAGWERLVVRTAQAHGIEPFEAERLLEKHVVTRLRKRENDASASSHTLYREFADAGLADIISLNFDRRIALAGAKEVFVAGPRRPREGPKGTTLYRHSRVSGRAGTTTRVWYPHGDTRRIETLRLGVRKYGFHLGLLQEHVFRSDSSWRDPSAAVAPYISDDERPDHGWLEPDDERPPSWVGVFRSRPLVFIGVGLSPDEWSLWWLLQMRSGEPGYYAHVGTLDRDLRQTLVELAAIEPVRFDSYDELWARVRGALT